MIVLFSIASLFYLVQFVAGWGADVHPTIGYLAERYLLDQTVTPFPIPPFVHCVEKPDRRNPRRRTQISRLYWQLR